MTESPTEILLRESDAPLIIFLWPRLWFVETLEGSRIIESALVLGQAVLGFILLFVAIRTLFFADLRWSIIVCVLWSLWRFVIHW